MLCHPFIHLGYSRSFYESINSNSGIIKITDKKKTIYFSTRSRFAIWRMANVKKELRYTKDHEWVLRENNAFKVGISDYAQENLGDIVFVDMPEAGQSLQKGDSAATIESVKAVSDVYAPVSGKIIEVNEDINNTPEIMNQEPYDGGWIFTIEAENVSEADDLLGAEEYETYIKTLDH